MLVLSGTGTGVTLFSFTIVNGTPSKIASARTSLVSLVSDEIVKMVLKTLRKATRETQKDYVLTRLTIKALINSDINQGEFMLIINEKK